MTLTGYYVSIIFLGSILILISLIWIIIDTKKTRDYDKKLEKKKNELVEIIQDAEQMVDELNKFSDYVVTTIEAKNEEVAVTLKNLESVLTKTKSVEAEVEEEKVVNGSSISSRVPSKDVKSKDQEIKNNRQKQGKKNQAKKEDQKEEDLQQRKPIGKSGNEIRPKDQADKLKNNKNSEKVIHLNNRHIEVLNLAKEGYGNAEIAKMLNIGIGEILLILGVNKK